MVSVPRELLQFVCDGGYCWPEAMENLRALLAQHQTDPVAVVGIVPGTGYKSLDFKLDLQLMEAGTKLYTHADTGKVERLRERVAMLTSVRRP